MANPNPNYPENYTFTVQVVGFANKLPQFYRQLEDGLTQPVMFTNSTQGKHLIQPESNSDPSAFLVFIRYVSIVSSDIVTVFHRNSDLKVVGRQTGDGMAYILNTSCLDKTKDCLGFYGIRYQVIDDLKDSSLESFAQMRMARVAVGALGLDLALAAFAIDDPNTNLRDTAYGFLYFTLLVSFPFRVGPIRTRVVNGFSGYGVEIPEEELQLDYAWRVLSYLLSPCHFSSVDHFDDYTLTDVQGTTMSSIQLADRFPVIKQTMKSEEIPLHTDMGEMYSRTVGLFYQEVLLNYPKS